MHFTPTGITPHGPPKVINLSSQVKSYGVWETHRNHGTSPKVPYKHPLAPFLNWTNLSSDLCFFFGGGVMLLLIVFNGCKMHSSTTQKEKLVWFYRFMSLTKGTPSLYIMVPCKFQAPLPRYIGNPTIAWNPNDMKSRIPGVNMEEFPSGSTSWDGVSNKISKTHCGDKGQGHKGFVSKHFSRLFLCHFGINMNNHQNWTIFHNFQGKSFETSLKPSPIAINQTLYFELPKPPRMPG